MTVAQLRRSALYVPASNERAMARARGLAADVIILDLEDAVAPAAKDDAREAAAAAVREGVFPGRELVVRLNLPEAQEGVADLNAIVPAGPDAILLPKIEGPEQIEQLCAALDESGAPRGLALWVMIETPKAVMHVGRIAEIGARRRVSALVAGVNDLAAGLRCRPGADRGALVPALMQIVTAARAHGLAPIDGVFNDIADAEGFAREARQARDLGFDGKSLIHPSQIAPTHAAYHPTEEEVAWARKVVQAYGDAANIARGAMKVDGKMVERLHLDDARRTLALAELSE
ncbi:MAG: CoA ester lyase [Caulobacterales bacterium]|nr:CoA ester lyase [Caulobacterales bacterium]